MEAELIEFPQNGRPSPVLGTTTAASPFRVDVARLMATRMLIQAMSGGGKSYGLRRLLEQTHGHVQQIVVDPEDELVTLAERFDFLVCSPESADAPIAPDKGAEVANLIFTSGRSAILSLGDFDLDEMQLFMADFITCLMRQPKDLWHYLMIVIDEAQLFAPQHDKAESKKPMIDLAGRGRKRGLCTVAATGRIAQLHKGVVAHLENKAIGLTTLDVDVERAAEQLGMRAGLARQQLRTLATGEFIAYGPALCHDLTTFKVAPVETRHGALGAYADYRFEPTMTATELQQQLQKVAGSGALAAAVETPEDDQAAPSVADQQEELVQMVLKRLQALRVAGGQLQFPRVDAPEGEVSPPSREDLCRRIARVRLEAIRPLLRSNVRRATTVQMRADALGIDAHHLRNWMTKFSPALGAVSLQPSKINQLMLDMLPRLEEVLFDVPPAAIEEATGDYLELSS